MFSRILRWTVVAVFFLIFIGSVVRSTGAGMGCPDWPKCFGTYVPPTSESELPENYISYYKEVRIKKNQKLEKLFKVFGLADVLHDRQNGHTTYPDIRFDLTKSWIEYLNRIVGVIVGFLVLGCFVFSFSYLKSKPSIVIWCFGALILLLIQAYLGSVVVSSNLFPELITVHMVLAMLLQCILLYVYFVVKGKKESIKREKNVPKVAIILSVVVLVLSFIQMFLGIEVRELIDQIHHNDGIYINEIQELIKRGNEFYIHRSFSILLIVFNVWCVFAGARYGVNNKYSACILPIIVFEIFAGVSLGYLDLTPYAQPFHLLLSTLLIGIQFLNFLYIKFAINKVYES